jgi:hypothetical protein
MTGPTSYTRLSPFLSQILFFTWWRAPQQMLRTHRSLKASCATPVMKISSFFLPSFTINGAPVEWNWQEKTDNSEKNLSQCHFVHHKPHMDWPQDRTRASAVRGRRLAAWAMTRPYHRFNTQHSLRYKIHYVLLRVCKPTAATAVPLTCKHCGAIFGRHFNPPVYQNYIKICFLAYSITKSLNMYTGHTQQNGGVLIVNTIKTAPFFCVCPVYSGIIKKVMSSLCMPWRYLEGTEIQLHSFLTFTLKQIYTVSVQSPTTTQLQNTPRDDNSNLGKRAYVQA